MPQRSWRSNSRARYRFPRGRFLVFSRPSETTEADHARRRRQIFLPIQRLTHGAIAQLGERIHGMDEVVGSIPTGSTTYPSASIPRSPQFPGKCLISKASVVHCLPGLCLDGLAYLAGNCGSNPRLLAPIWARDQSGRSRPLSYSPACGGSSRAVRSTQHIVLTKTVGRSFATVSQPGEDVRLSSHPLSHLQFLRISAYRGPEKR